MLKIMVRTHTCKVIKTAYVTPSTELPKMIRNLVNAFTSTKDADFAEIRYKWGVVRVTRYDADNAAFDCASLISDLSNKETRLLTLGDVID